MINEKLKPENLTASERSPVIPLIKETEKALKASARADKAAKKAEEKAGDLVKGELSEPVNAPTVEKETYKAHAGRKVNRPEKAKPEKKAAKKDAPLTFPAAVRINDYAFLHFTNGLLKALDWHKGMALTIEKNADGSATIRKA